MSTLLLRTVALGRRQQCVSIEVALDLEEGGLMTVLTLVCAIAFKLTLNLSLCNPPIAIKPFSVTFDDFGG